MTTISLPDQGTAPHGNFGVAIGNVLKYPEVSSCLTITLINKGDPCIFGGAHIAMTGKKGTTSRSEIIRYLLAMNRLFAESVKGQRQLKQAPQKADCAWIVGHIGVWKESESEKVQSNYSFIENWVRNRAKAFSHRKVQDIVENLRIKIATTKFPEDMVKAWGEIQEMKKKQSSVDISFNPSTKKGVIHDRKVTGPDFSWLY